MYGLKFLLVWAGPLLLTVVVLLGRAHVTQRFCYWSCIVLKVGWMARMGQRRFDGGMEVGLFQWFRWSQGKAFVLMDGGAVS